MTAACHYSYDGLIAGHAYTLVGVNYDTGRIMMRNPWSDESYYGEGSDQTNDGFFELPVSTFVNAFPNFSIAYYQEWYATQLGPQVGSSGLNSGWTINNPTNQYVIVTLDLVPEKMVAATCTHAQEYIALTVKENGSTVGTEYAFSKSKPSVNVHLSDPGTY